MAPATRTETPTGKAMQGSEWAMLLALSALWGGSFFFNALAVREVPTFTAVLARVAIAALVLNALLFALRTPPSGDRRIWAAFFAMGALNNVLPFSLIVWGQAHIASGLAAILNATTPLFTVLLAHVATSDERLTAPRLLGVSAGLAGVVVLLGGGGPAVGGGGGGVGVVAQLACLAAAVSYAFAGIFGRRFRTMGVTPTAAAAGQVTASAVLLAPLVAFIDRPWTLLAPSGTALAALLGVAVLSTALAYILYFRILERAGATNLLLVTFLIPVSALLLGVGVLGETLLTRHLAGMALIGAGLAAIDGRPWRVLRRMAGKG
jgi:drug/metabolite transporter (DMT)-like permease